MSNLILLLKAEICGGEKMCPISSSTDTTNGSLVLYSNEIVAFISLTLIAD